MKLRFLGLAAAVVLVAACGEDAPNNPPTVSGQPVATPEDTAVTASFPATDDDQDPLTFHFSTPMHGAVTGAGPQFTYTPVADYHGTDAVTATVSDGKAPPATATITITV